MEAQLLTFLKKGDDFLLENAQKVMAEIPVVLSPIGAILATYLLAFLASVLASVFATLHGDYSPSTPRDGTKSALSRRLKGAHYNTFETLFVFGLAVVLCTITGVDAELLSMYCNLFVVVRVAYVVAYALSFHGTLAPVRSAVFFVSLLIVVQLFVLAGKQNGGFLFKLK